MPRTLQRVSPQHRVAPSIVNPATAEPFTLEQELQPFGAWTGDPLWVPPKDSSVAMADTMLRETRPFASQAARWGAVFKKHQSEFTQVREIDLFAPSIRLPQGKFFVTVIEQENFDKITDAIPACVQTRLDEFLSGPWMRRGAKVYYVKPLCVELGDELILTTRDDLMAAMTQVRREVFAEYRRQAYYRRSLQALTAAVNFGLALPRTVVRHVINSRQKAVNAYQARLEFERRKLALEVARTHRKLRTDGCTFEETLELTSPLKRTDVIEQFCRERDISRAKRDQLLMIAAGSIPWFVGLSLTISYAASLALMTSTPPLVVCDPAFIAELPGSGGVVLKIGHFDEVGGVTHVEI